MAVNVKCLHNKIYTMSMSPAPQHYTTYDCLQAGGKQATVTMEHTQQLSIILLLWLIYRENTHGLSNKEGKGSICYFKKFATSSLLMTSVQEYTRSN